MSRLEDRARSGFYEIRSVSRAVVFIFFILVIATALFPTWAGAQMYGGRMASRSDLTASLDSLQQVMAATNGRDRLDEIQRQILGIRYRLEHGDIWSGDVVSLAVSGEARWTGEFTVSPSRALELPDIDQIPLAGVMYAEAKETVSRALIRYLRDPRVSIDVLKRIAILGQVGTPGFYNVKGSALVSDALMLAGGPSSTAKVRAIKIRRGGEQVAPGRPQVAFESLSLDRLGVVSGDEVFVPGKSGPPTQVFLGVLGAAATMAILISRLSR